MSSIMWAKSYKKNKEEYYTRVTQFNARFC
jgi:hypothetical protein